MCGNRQFHDFLCKNSSLCVMHILFLCIDRSFRKTKRRTGVCVRLCFRVPHDRLLHQVCHHRAMNRFEQGWSRRATCGCRRCTRRQRWRGSPSPSLRGYRCAYVYVMYVCGFCVEHRSCHAQPAVTNASQSDSGKMNTTTQPVCFVTVKVLCGGAPWFLLFGRAFSS